MIIYADNMCEYVAGELALCGELDKSLVLARAPEKNRSNIRNAITILKKNKIVKEHKYDDGKKFLRFSSVNSKEYLKGISEELCMQAETMVNPEMKYSGSKVSRMRERCNYELYDNLQVSGISINGIVIEKRDNRLGASANDPKLKGYSIFSEGRDYFQPEKMYGYINSEGIEFFTKRAIKKKQEDGTINREGSHGARFAGMLRLDGQVFFVYPMRKAIGTSWRPQAEFDSANYVCGNLERYAPYFRNKRVTPSCIMCYPNAEEATKQIYSDDMKSIRTDPCKIYKKSYIVPEFGLNETFLKLIRKPKWKTEVIKAIFPDMESSDMADAILPDGTEVYNFLALDLNHVRYSIARIMGLNNNVIIIAPDWAGEALEKLFPRDGVNIIKFSLGDCKTIAASI